MADAPDLTLFHSTNLESRVKALENSCIKNQDIKSATFSGTPNQNGALLLVTNAKRLIIAIAFTQNKPNGYFFRDGSNWYLRCVETGTVSGTRTLVPATAATSGTYYYLDLE